MFLACIFPDDSFPHIRPALKTDNPHSAPSDTRDINLSLKSYHQQKSVSLSPDNPHILQAWAHIQECRPCSAIK